jgi:tetratricopeptide (TPR) repeat protein
MIDLGDLANDGCTMGIGWEKTWVSFPIKLTTDEVVTTAINKTMAGPNADDYYNAGRYYFESGKDLKQAYEWIHKSNEMDGKDAKFWKLRQESLVLAAQGKYKDALAVAEKSKTLAVTAGNKDYERMNTESIAEWKKKM